MLRRYITLIVRHRLVVMLVAVGFSIFFASKIGNLRVVVDPNDNLPQEHPQLDRVQEELTGRIKATWWNKTLEGELLGVWNANRSDFFLRPSLAYAFTDVWKGFIGWDIFNGRRESFYGFFQPMTTFFVEIRATF